MVIYEKNKLDEGALDQIGAPIRHTSKADFKTNTGE